MKKTFVTAVVTASALALSACAGETSESVEETGEEMAADAEAGADAMVDEGEAMAADAESMVEEGADATEATAEEANPVDGTNNPVGPREQ